MNYEACRHCVCNVCEDRGCVECALCKGRYKTDGCSEAFITPRKKRASKKKRRNKNEKAS